jgi:protein SCO1/2
MNIKRLGFTLLLFLVALFGYLASINLSNGLEKDLKSQYLKAGNFKLDYQNTSFELNSLKGQPVILYFGYTHCPDVCPVGLAVIRDVLNSNDKFEQVKALFVTLDPERDTPEKLQKYTAFFHSNILGLTGSDQEIREMSASYGTSFRRADTVLEAIDGQEGYTIDHSTYYYLIDSAGELVRVLDYASKPEEIADLLIKLI